MKECVSLLPMISVIIPTYNASKYIERCVDSILNQTHKNIEVLIIDDGSQDDTLMKLKKFQDRIKVIQQKNSGPSEARNRGIQSAKGEYITFVDADDQIDKHHLEYLYSAISCENNEVAACLFSRDELDDCSNEEVEIENFNQNNALKKIVGINQVMGFVWNKLYRKNIILEHQIYFDRDRKNMEDLAFNLKYFKYVNMMALVCCATYQYRIVSDGIVNGGRNFGADMSPKWLQAINDYQSIYDIIHRDYEAASEVFLGVMTWEYNVLRLLIRESNSFRENTQIYNVLTKFVKKNKKRVLNSSEFSFKKKCALIVLLHCPFFMDILVKIKNINFLKSN